MYPKVSDKLDLNTIYKLQGYISILWGISANGRLIHSAKQYIQLCMMSLQMGVDIKPDYEAQLKEFIRRNFPIR